MIRVKEGKSYELWQDGQLVWGPGSKREMEAYEYRLTKLSERRHEYESMDGTVDKSGVLARHCASGDWDAEGTGGGGGGS